MLLDRVYATGRRMEWKVEMIVGLKVDSCDSQIRWANYVLHAPNHLVLYSCSCIVFLGPDTEIQHIYHRIMKNERKPKPLINTNNTGISAVEIIEMYVLQQC